MNPYQVVGLALAGFGLVVFISAPLVGAFLQTSELLPDAWPIGHAFAQAIVGLICAVFGIIWATE